MAATLYDSAADVCPICGASGMAPCAEEDGQYVLDHWGRLPMDAPPEAFRQNDRGLHVVEIPQTAAA
jgi:hypothetical protein